MPHWVHEDSHENAHGKFGSKCTKMCMVVLHMFCDQYHYLKDPRAPTRIKWQTWFWEGQRPSDSQVRKNSLNIKFLGGIFLGHPGPRRWDIPDKNFMQVALFCCFRQRVAGMSRDLGRDVPDLEKLYARKLWADFSYPRFQKGQKWLKFQKWLKTLSFVTFEPFFSHVGIDPPESLSGYFHCFVALGSLGGDIGHNTCSISISSMDVHGDPWLAPVWWQV